MNPPVPFLHDDTKNGAVSAGSVTIFGLFFDVFQFRPTCVDVPELLFNLRFAPFALYRFPVLMIQREFEISTKAADT